MADIFHIGRVFTPLPWATWLIEIAGAFRAWLDGASVLDPTCGDGAFLEAFVALARRDGIGVTGEALGRLHGIEIVEADKPRLFDRMRARYGVELANDSIVTADFITAEIPTRYDVIVGNPPWINFTDLPHDLKAKWGPAFIRHQLVHDKREVLLGSSRADVASLVVKKALDDVLADRGRAAFFIPLSLFFNSGANDRFRPFPGSAHRYRVSRLWDFGEERVFEGISTRYGTVLFDRPSRRRSVTMESGCAHTALPAMVAAARGSGGRRRKPTGPACRPSRSNRPRSRVRASTPAARTMSSFSSAAATGSATASARSVSLRRNCCSH
jgi:hypothetical protein